MAARKKAAKEEPPPEEPLAEEQEENGEDENAEKEDERPKRTLLHLPRGPGRPVVGQVLSFLSEPHLKEDLRQTFSSFGSEGVEVNHRDTHMEFRKTLQQDLQYLDMQTTKRKAEAKRRRETERYLESARLGHQKFLENARLGKQRPPWTYTDAPGFMEPPIYEQGEALTCNRNEFMCGIYSVQHPDYKPPHAECDSQPNVYGTWTPFQTNIRNEMLYEFRDKEWQGTKMSPADKMFKERLDRSIERATQLTKQDALDRTSGVHKKEMMMKTAPEFSCLKKTKAAWHTQQVSTHTYFEEPKHAYTFKARCPNGHEMENLGKAKASGWTCGGIKNHGGCRSGITGQNGPAGIYQYGCKKCNYYLCKNCYDQPGDCYDTSINMYIEQPDRAMSYKKNMITANGSKSFWKPPTKGVLGTTRRLQTAQELLHRNMRGCTGLKPTPSPTRRTMLLKGTGSLSFTHFKDALQEPTFPCFSPCDRSGPP